MTYALESLKVSRLQVMEAGQLTSRTVNDVGTIDPELKTDVPYNNYVSKLGEISELYFRALAQVRKREETELIVKADGLRDKTISSFKMAVKLHLAAPDTEEAEAARGLSILSGAYNDIAKMGTVKEPSFQKGRFLSMKRDPYGGCERCSGGLNGSPAVYSITNWAFLSVNGLR